MRTLLAVVISLLVASCSLVAAPDYLPPKLLTGSIYDKPGGRLLFTFRRTATQTGDVVSVLREFHNPDGSLVSQERVKYERGRLERFELDERQTGASGRAVAESIGNQRQRIHFQYTTRSGRSEKTKQKTETVSDQPLISDMLPGVIAEHWD